MKRLFTLILSIYLCVCSLNASPVKANVAIGCYVSVAWGSWENYSTYVSGTYDEFYLHPDSDQPWNYYFKLKIYNYHAPTKEEIKHYKKSGEWVKYVGQIEYAVDDRYPELIDALKKFNRPLMHKDHRSWDHEWKKPMIRKEKIVTVIFIPTKKGPGTINIFIDDIAIGLNLHNCLKK